MRDYTKEDAMAGPRPVVMSGPSGAGKSTLLKKLLKEFDGVFGFSVSHTTRNPRPGEENGKDYHYVTRAVMQKSIANGEFIESAEFSGNMYGTSKAAVQAVQARNLICVLDVDMQGVKNIKRTDLNPLYVSVQPPSMDVLNTKENILKKVGNRIALAPIPLCWIDTKPMQANGGHLAAFFKISFLGVFCGRKKVIQEKRLRDRKTESEESLQKRLHAANVDMEKSKEPGLFDVVIINDDVAVAYEKLKEALLPEIQKVKVSNKA